MQKSFEDTWNEIYTHYPEAVEEWAKRQFVAMSSMQLVGSSTDETLQRVYKREGYYECVHQFLSDFRP